MTTLNPCTAAEAANTTTGPAVEMAERERFHIQTIEGPDRVTVRIAGEVDLACAESLAQAFGLALATLRPVVVDCSQITFMDSTGLQAFAKARLLADEGLVELQLSSVSEPVMRVLELSGMTSLFNIATEPVQASRGTVEP